MPADSPRIDVPASASPEQAAALVAAVEQFLRDTTVAPAPRHGATGWMRAARLEAVGRDPAEVDAPSGGGGPLWAT